MYVIVVPFAQAVPGPRAQQAFINEAGIDRYPARTHIGYGMLELHPGEPERGEPPPGDNLDYFAAYPAAALPRSYAAADHAGRMVVVDRENGAVRDQAASGAVDRVPGGVCSVAPVGAPGAPGARALDIDHSRSRIPSHHLGVLQHSQCIGSVVLGRTAQQQTAGQQLHARTLSPVSCWARPRTPLRGQRGSRPELRMFKPMGACRIVLGRIRMCGSPISAPRIEESPGGRPG